jgi:hypothetical protein
MSTFDTVLVAISSILSGGTIYLNRRTIKSYRKAIRNYEQIIEHLKGRQS